ncbi:MAG: hypothetical protein LBI54_00290 [Lachnospiraceae bacterium]|jgi:hypothetical protein|nr:hypothetical protein [Lachnospiraceae bacterium]
MQAQTFSVSNGEVICGEHSSHRNKPMLTFNPSRRLLYINAAGLKRLPDMEYALIAISPSEKRLSILPCGVEEREAIRLRSGGRYRNKPHQIRCLEVFSEKMLSLMEWRRDCRYKMFGYVAVGDDDTIIVFDLSSAESEIYMTERG